MWWTAEMTSVPYLRLHRPEPRESTTHAPVVPTQATLPTATRLAVDDPRWILARETRHRLQGAVLTPIDRHWLLERGVGMGLTGFDANLIVAIVQDQARRGHGLERAEALLTMIAAPRRRRGHWARGIGAAVLAAAALAIQIFLIASLSY
jgi:hypothetical protein